MDGVLSIGRGGFNGGGARERENESMKNRMWRRNWLKFRDEEGIRNVYCISIRRYGN